VSVLVSAHNPMTGPRHLGHLVSTMADWPALGNEYDDVFLVIDDLIATLLYPAGREHVDSRSLTCAKEFLCSGIRDSRFHVVLTSMVPEAIELAHYLSMGLDHPWCDRLYEETFAGRLDSYQRAQLGLGKYPSVAEVVFPQLGLASLALGLGATGFQGGEEMRGYLDIMTTLAGAHSQLEAPAFVPGGCMFLTGTDGRHMATENAIFLSEPKERVFERLATVADNRIFAEWAAALGDRDLSTKVLRDSPDGARSAIAELLSERLAPFRDSRLERAGVVEELQRGAFEARERVRDALVSLKTALYVTGFG